MLPLQAPLTLVEIPVELNDSSGVNTTSEHLGADKSLNFARRSVHMKLLGLLHELSPIVVLLELCHVVLLDRVGRVC